MKRNKSKRNRAVIGGQWGDEGKGKIIDVLMEDADINVRPTGGANAGHTLCVNGKKYVLHLVPSGIVRPSTMNVMGNGMAIDPRSLCEELRVLSEAGIDWKGRIKMALNANLVMPEHFVIEAARESGKGAVGSTMRGMSPCYTDRTARIGLIVNDLLNPKLLAEKLERNLEEKRFILEHFGKRWVKRVMKHERLQHGRFYSNDGFFNLKEIVAAYTGYGRMLERLITDTDTYLREQLGKASMVFEGAQGFVLSLDYGSYPDVTSSDPGIEGLMKGAGLPVNAAGKVYLVLKAPAITRVGKGSFPTEMGGNRSAEWCESHKQADEELRWPSPNINSRDEMEQGVAVRRLGGEYGATTGRPRRCGWFDAPLARRAFEVNKGTLILTKLDVMSSCKTLRICTGYIYEGPRIRWGETELRKGTSISTAITREEVLAYCNPQYIEMPGWRDDISKTWTWRGLPRRCKQYVARIEELVGSEVSGLSVGPDREAMIWR